MKHLSTISKAPNHVRGMTLVEIMFAMSIGVVVLGIALNMLIGATRATRRVQSNTENDLTEWGVSASVTIDTRIANGMSIYKDFALANFNDASDRITTDSARGNFLVLTQSRQAADSKTTTYTTLSGYLYTAGATTGTGTFKRFAYNVPTADSTKTLEEILAAHYNDFQFVLLATGLEATHSDGATIPTNRAFQCRSFKLHSGVLNLEITSGFAKTGTKNTKLIETAFFIRN